MERNNEKELVSVKVTSVRKVQNTGLQNDYQFNKQNDNQFNLRGHINMKSPFQDK